MDKPKIYIGADHAGFKLKESVKQHLATEGYKVEDLGTETEDSVDYPDFAKKVSEKVVKDPKSRGLLFCGTGIGMSIAANKVKGIRAAVIHDGYTAKVAAEHNAANIACLGGRTLEPDDALSITKVYLSTPWSDEQRHVRRVSKMDKMC